MTGPTDRLASLSERYRIERELGAGGMATVYLAHDVRHDRRVALKVLRPELAAVIGADRFLAEIRTTANLQHPHILPLFDSGQVDGTVFYVMPYVDGESLRDRITREKQLPIEDALRIASEVGDALQYAHGLGVIHRDIKPENILLKSGHALVADFGIALAAVKTGGTRMTETGMSLGTPRYMSPEQAMGERDLGAGSDIYALGCVVYEMLTGDAPFTASTAQAIVAKVLTEKPASIIAQRDRVPPHVEDAVLTALEKLPADRFATAAEFVGALKDGGASRLTTRTRVAAGGRSLRPLMATGAAVAVFAAVGGWLVGRGRPTPGELQPSQLALVEPGSNITFDGTRRTIDISEDGETVVWVADRPGGTAVLARRLDGSASRVLIDRQDGNIHLSPDGRFLYSSQGSGTLQRLALAGGAPTPVTGVEATPYLAFAEDSAIWWGSVLNSGTWKHSPDGRDSLVFPRSTIMQMLPGDKFALGVELKTGINFGTAVLMDLRTRETSALFETPVIEIRYARGYLLFVRTDNVIAAVPFDPASGRVTGTPVDIATNVSVSTVGFAQWAVSENGTVVYIPGAESDLVRVSRDGRVTVLQETRRRYHSPRISPDGRRISYDDVSGEGRDVWVYSESSRDVKRATFQRDGHDAEWAADGRSLYYLGANGPRLEIFRTTLGTTAPARPENMTVEVSHTGTRIHGDSTVITTVAGAKGRGLDIVRIVRGKATVDTLLGTEADETFAVASPDGRWYAYISDHSSRPELYIRSLGASDVQLQVSVDGATEPVWSRDGREIFYRSGSKLLSARLQLGSEPSVIDRKELFEVTGYDAAAPHAAYDVSPDGSWFVFARRGGANHIVVLQNVAELARRVASGGSTPP